MRSTSQQRSGVKIDYAPANTVHQPETSVNSLPPLYKICRIFQAVYGIIFLTVLSPTVLFKNAWLFPLYCCYLFTTSHAFYQLGSYKNSTGKLHLLLFAVIDVIQAELYVYLLRSYWVSHPRLLGAGVWAFFFKCLLAVHAIYSSSLFGTGVIYCISHTMEHYQLQLSRKHQ